MEVVARSRRGFLVEATKEELEDLMRSAGHKDPEPNIGTNLPIYDFRKSMEDVLKMTDGYSFKKIQDGLDEITKRVNQLSSLNGKLRKEQEGGDLVES